MNDSDLDTVEEVNAVLQVRFTGLKAEAAVLNGVALTAAQVADLLSILKSPSMQEPMTRLPIKCR